MEILFNTYNENLALNYIIKVDLVNHIHRDLDFKMQRNNCLGREINAYVSEFWV